MENDLDITKLDYIEQISPVPWPFIISRFHCSTVCGNTLVSAVYSLYSHTLSSSVGIKIVGISNPALLSPGLLQSSWVICIKTF